MITRNIDLDQEIYDEAARRFEAVKAVSFPHHGDVLRRLTFSPILQAHGEGLDEEMICFRKMQDTLEQICAEHPGHELCVWYADPDFFSLINDSGYSKPVL